MMCLEWSNMLRSWSRFCNWIMVPCLHPLCYFVVVGWRMGLTIEANPPTNVMMLTFCLQNFDMCWMNLMNLFFPKQVQQCSFGVTPRHYGHWWKFVLHKEPISQQIVANTYDDYIDICGVMFGFKVHWNF